MAGPKALSGDILPGGALGARKHISHELALYIKLQLEPPSPLQETKAALQRLCALYEAGWTLREPAAVRLLVRGLLWAPSPTIIRRWAYKAIGLVGVREDAAQLYFVLKNETDPENQTWAMYAIRRLSKGRAVQEICEEAGVELTPPLVMAGQLFRSGIADDDLPAGFAIDIDVDNSLTLLWACLLEGYGRAPIKLFKSGASNLASVQQLQKHETPTVSEYAIWSLWNNPRYGIDDLSVPMADIQTRAPGARRWINRLITKASTLTDEHVELIQDLILDEDDGARDGLAIGLRSSFNIGLPAVVIEWYGREHSEVVRRGLLEHMASYSEFNAAYLEYALEGFRMSTNKNFRQRLISASEGLKLYGLMRQVEAEENINRSSIDLFNLNGTIPAKILGVQQVNNTFNFNAPVSGQNQVFGTASGNAFNAVQNMTESQAGQKELLTELLKALENDTSIGAEQKAETQAAITAVATAPSPENKAALMDKLTGVATTVGKLAGAAAPVLKLIEAAQNLF